MRTVKIRLWDGKRFVEHTFSDAMECTGLLDINEQEIYEGDVVIDRDGYAGIVIWDENAFCFRVKDGTGDYQLDEYGWDGNELKVIGNVLENPEILEDE